MTHSMKRTSLLGAAVLLGMLALLPNKDWAVRYVWMGRGTTADGCQTDEFDIQGNDGSHRTITVVLPWETLDLP